jgi:hypothetical protein
MNDTAAPKCDTPSQAKMQWDDNGENKWCRRCWNAFNASEGEAANDPCHQCSTVHLREFMFDKIPGRFCRSCTRQYERGLMRKIA